jgi:hypothetical protein
LGCGDGDLVIEGDAIDVLTVDGDLIVVSGWPGRPRCGVMVNIMESLLKTSDRWR